jgi:hypothetical protein
MTLGNTPRAHQISPKNIQNFNLNSNKVSAVGLHGKSAAARKQSSKRVLEQHRTFGQALTEIDNNEKSLGWGCRLKIFQKGSKICKVKTGSKNESIRVENIAVENLIGGEKNPGYLPRQSREDDLQKKLSNADLQSNRNLLGSRK